MTNTWKCDVCKTGQVEGEMKSEEIEDNGIKTEMLEACFVCKHEVVTDTENIKTESAKTEDIKQEIVDDYEVNTLEQNIDIALANRSLDIAVHASFLHDDEYQQKKLRRELHDEERLNTPNNTRGIYTEGCTDNVLQSISNSIGNRPTENSTLSEAVVSLAQNDAIKRCVECKFVYTRPGSLKLHNIVHLSDPPYHCSICEYESRQASKFNNHILVHTRDKPFCCMYCNSCFSQLTALHRHLKARHPSYYGMKCEQCDYIACHQTQLINHKDKVHSISSAADIIVLKCDKCPFIYTKSDSLLLHKKVHESDCPYACSKCEYKSSGAGDYNKHVYTHTHDKPHACVHCNSCFSLLHHLRRHLKSVHPDCDII